MHRLRNLLASFKHTGRRNFGSPGRPFAPLATRQPKVRIRIQIGGKEITQ